MIYELIILHVQLL